MLRAFAACVGEAVKFTRSLVGGADWGGAFEDLGARCGCACGADAAAWRRTARSLSGAVDARDRSLALASARTSSAEEAAARWRGTSAKLNAQVKSARDAEAVATALHAELARRVRAWHAHRESVSVGGPMLDHEAERERALLAEVLEAAGCPGARVVDPRGAVVGWTAVRD